MLFNDSSLVRLPSPGQLNWTNEDWHLERSNEVGESIAANNKDIIHLSSFKLKNMKWLSLEVVLDLISNGRRTMDDGKNGWPIPTVIEYNASASSLPSYARHKGYEVVVYLKIFFGHRNWSSLKFSQLSYTRYSEDLLRNFFKTYLLERFSLLTFIITTQDRPTNWINSC